MTLEFREDLQDAGGARWPTAGRIEAFRDGAPAGYVDFLLSPRGARALIRMIDVRAALRRHRIGAALMDELRRRHPDVTTLELPELLPDGRRFFAWYRRRMRERR